MKQKIITVVMVITVLLLPMRSGAIGPAVNVVLKDANGVKVGSVIGMEDASWPYVLTDEGYRTYFKMGNGMVQVVVGDGDFLYYDQSCADGGGNAYLAGSHRKRLIGTVFSPLNNIQSVYTAGGLLYSPTNAQLVQQLHFLSKHDADGNCTDINELSAEGFPAYPNDPNITGIENTAYPNRMLIE
jgi:hypothetical protein